MKKKLQKYFQNNEIGFIHVIAIFVTLFSLFALFFQSTAEDITMDILASFVVIALLYATFRISKDSPKMKLIAIAMIVLFYVSVMLLVNDFAKGQISDTMNYILSIPPIAVGIYFLVKAVKQNSIKK